MDKLGRFGWTIVSFFFIWLSVGMVNTIYPDLTVFAVVMGFFGSLALWVVAGLAQFADESHSEEKTKRDASGGDARLALLLELMGEDERQALKRRLIDDLGSDGEAVPLADLLAAQNEQTTQRRR